MIKPLNKKLAIKGRNCIHLTKEIKTIQNKCIGEALITVHLQAKVSDTYIFRENLGQLTIKAVMTDLQTGQAK